MNYYIDSSAAVKQYVTEIGSLWLQQLSLSEVASSQLLRVELRSAFARRYREGSLTLAEYLQAKQWFIEHSQTLYQLVPIHEQVLQTAADLVERHPLRAGDAIHLATAIIVNQQLLRLEQKPLTFLSADARLNSAAQTEGLVVDNPNLHP